MRGMMMDLPLLVSGILRHAESVHGDAEVVSRGADGGLARSTYAEVAARSRRLARALDRLGLEPGDRVGTLAWNGARHLEVYFAASGSGRVCHTINPRLFPDQVAAIAAHAGDALLFVDPSLLPLAASLLPSVPSVRAVVALGGPGEAPAVDLPVPLLDHDALIAGETDGYAWPALDEREAAGLCYTSGTTGAPKGVLYSHRSTVLHALSISVPDAFGVSAQDSVMPVVPMFHVNAWGLPYAAAMAGAKLVMPGPRLDGASLHGMIRDEAVTLTAGVPTVWAGLLDWVDARGAPLEPLRRVGIGGSACPPAMVARFAARGVDVVHAWGMTETSPVAVVNRPTRAEAALDRDTRIALARKQGRPLFGVEVRAAGPGGEPVPRDGASFGAMSVRGPCVAARYFGSEGEEAFAEPGWFATGDIVTVDALGLIEIVDRSKDVVKSGGEWISSIELENIAVGHPSVREAAVVARPDPRWGERPVLFVVPAEGATFGPAEMEAAFAGRVPRWMVPTDLRIVADLPHTATGKLHKAAIRRML